VAAAVELLCVGTELLLGNILNGNARWLAKQLRRPGRRRTTVSRWWATTANADGRRAGGGDRAAGF
jgi:hypothetical protein